jgi:DNA-binding NarL/FixJ family response regulator
MINVMHDKSTTKSYFNQIWPEITRPTSRELEILSLFASDLCDKQIADHLGITESTLNTHKKNLFEKFDVHSKSGLISKAFHQKIIQ